MALSQTGSYLAAEHAFREALAIAERSAIDERQIVELHHALAGAYAEAGKFAESESEYRRALALVEKGDGQGSRHYAVLLADNRRNGVGSTISMTYQGFVVTATGDA